MAAASGVQEIAPQQLKPDISEAFVDAGLEALLHPGSLRHHE